MKPLEIIGCLIVGTGMTATLVPIILSKQEQAIQMRAASGLAITGRALLQIEEELGALPKAGWENDAEIFATKRIQDPTYNGKSSGWGVNLRTELTTGSPAREDPDKRSSKNLPPDAVLLLASDTETISPNRDGTIDLVKGARDPRRRHGKKSPYFLAGGNVVVISREEGEKLLELRKLPPSLQNKETRAAETKKIKEAWEASQDGQGVYGGYITLESGSVDTPDIPTRGRLPKISFETYSEIEQNITTRIVYLNKNGDEINYLPSNKIIYPETSIDLQRNKADRYKEDLPPPVGFNAEYGHAEQAPGAHYKKGRGIVTTTDFSQMDDHKTGPQWELVEVLAGSPPTGTEFVKVTIGKEGARSAKETIIRNIKASYPEIPANPENL